jgi:Winged helix DNA-binding domain
MLIAERYSAQLLAGQPACSAVDVVARLLAVQGQDPRGARLAIRARSAGLLAADVDRALTVDRSLLTTWLNRGTLHLVRSEDFWWLRALTSPLLRSGSARRLAAAGVLPDAADRGVAAIEAALTAEGPLTRAQLAERVAAVGVPTQGQAMLHLLFLASLRGIAVRGPVIGAQHAYVLVRDWLGGPPAALDRDVALAELARRYLAGHGPAAERDLAQWAGMPLRDARRGLAAIADQLDQREDDLAALRRRADGAGLPPPRLLGPYDPLLLGWASREPVLGSHQEVITVNGLFRPFALVAGRAAATWTIADGKIDLAPFDPLPASVANALESEAVDVRRFLGSPPAPEDSADGRH